MGEEVDRGGLEDGEGPIALWATPVNLARCAVIVLGI